MKSQVLHTVWCYISGEAAGEFWHWSLSGVKGLNYQFTQHHLIYFSKSWEDVLFWAGGVKGLDNEWYKYQKKKKKRHERDA